MDMTDGRSLFSKWGNLIPQAPRTSLSKDQTETEAVMRRWERGCGWASRMLQGGQFFQPFFIFPDFSLTSENFPLLI